MKIQNSYIQINKLTFFAYHGVASQEAKVGNEYYIDLRIKVDYSKAILSDEVKDTLSYADVFTVIQREMDIPSKLLEHVCGRIVEKLFTEFEQIDEIKITLNKRMPPMGADVDSAGVEMLVSRD